MCGWHLPMVRLHSHLQSSRITDRAAGLYEQQDEGQAAHNLCGKFVTGEDGEYSFYAIRPTPYPVPSLGPVGKLLQMMDKPAFRPAHIHFLVWKTLPCVGHRLISCCEGLEGRLSAYHDATLRRGEQVPGD